MKSRDLKDLKYSFKGIFLWVTSWQIDQETVTDFIFLGSEITADGNCSHEIKDTCSLEEKL